jgi:O-succinylbenzoate synthase
VIHIDCNSAYSLADLDMFKELDQYSLAMIEQPLAHDDLVDHATLQRQLRTPLCLDESITSVDKARQAIEIGACRWVNIKHGRVGGITNAVEINRVCAANKIPCWIGGMLESAVGQAYAVALATLDNIQYPSDIFPSSRFYRQDLGTPAMVHSGPSQFTASELPGIGVVPDEELLRKLSLEDVTLG